MTHVRRRLTGNSSNEWGCSRKERRQLCSATKLPFVGVYPVLQRLLARITFVRSQAMSFPPRKSNDFVLMCLCFLMMISSSLTKFIFPYWSEVRLPFSFSTLLKCSADTAGRGFVRTATAEMLSDVNNLGAILWHSLFSRIRHVQFVDPDFSLKRGTVTRHRDVQEISDVRWQWCRDKRGRSGRSVTRNATVKKSEWGKEKLSRRETGTEGRKRKWHITS